MQTELQTIDISNLDHVTGGSGAGTTAKVIAKGAGKVASRAIPIAGQVLTVADAGYEAYSDYSTARQNGATVPQAVGQGALGALNSLTFGASNWLLNRNQ